MQCKVLVCVTHVVYVTNIYTYDYCSSRRMFEMAYLKLTCCCNWDWIDQRVKSVGVTLFGADASSGR